MEKGKLYIIATPIGNLEDITLRALKILEEIDVLFCEDTRETVKLMNFYKIKKRLISNNETNELRNVDKVIKFLEEGKKVGLVTDRGTPLISDPGYKIVEKAISENYEICSIPGASALITALPLAGFPINNFIFVGFLDKNNNKRKKKLENLKLWESAVVFYESPQRITKLLDEILGIFGDRKIIISREITKRYETHYRGLISEVAKQVKDIKGEIVLIVEGIPAKKSISKLKIREMVQNYIDEGMSCNVAIKKVAEEVEESRNEIYKTFHKI